MYSKFSESFFRVISSLANIKTMHQVRIATQHITTAHFEWYKAYLLYHSTTNELIENFHTNKPKWGQFQPDMSSKQPSPILCDAWPSPATHRPHSLTTRYNGKGHSIQQHSFDRVATMVGKRRDTERRRGREGGKLGILRVRQRRDCYGRMSYFASLAATAGGCVCLCVERE